MDLPSFPFEPLPETAIIVHIPYRGDLTYAEAGIGTHPLGYHDETIPPNMSSALPSPKRSARDITPEVSHHAPATYFEFPLRTSIDFGCAIDCDVRLREQGGISGKHFSLVFTHSDTWMLLSRSRHELVMDDVRIEQGCCRAVNPSCAVGSRITLGSHLVVDVHLRWCLSPRRFFDEPSREFKRLSLPEKQAKDGPPPFWMSKLRQLPTNLSREKNRYWIIPQMSLAGSPGCRAINKLSGRGGVAYRLKGHKEWAIIYSEVRRKWDDPCDYLSRLVGLGLEGGSYYIVEPYYGESFLHSATPGQVCQMLGYALSAVDWLHSKQTLHGSITSDCIALVRAAPGCSERIPVLTQAWRSVNETGCLLPCDDANKEKDRADLARVMVDAIEEECKVSAMSSHGTGRCVRLPRPLSLQDPILDEVLIDMQKGHDVISRVKSLPRVAFFDTFDLSQTTKFHPYTNKSKQKDKKKNKKKNKGDTENNDDTRYLRLKPVIKVVRGQVFRRHNPDENEKAPLQRLEAFKKACQRDLDIQVLKTLLRPFQKTFDGLLTELDNLKGETSFLLETTFKMSYLSQWDLINITHFQISMQLGRQSIALSDQDIEIIGKSEQQGIYVTRKRFEELASEVSYQWQTEPRLRTEESRYIQALQKIDPREYVFLATGWHWAPLVPIERREPHRADLRPFGSAIGASLESRLMSCEELISLCETYGADEAKSALIAFVKNDQKSKPLKFGKPLRPDLPHQSGSDTDIDPEEQPSNRDPAKFQRRDRTHSSTA